MQLTVIASPSMETNCHPLLTFPLRSTRLIKLLHLAIEVAIDRLNASQATIAKAKAVFANMGVDGIFGRSDIAAITNDSVTAAGNLITKLKNADLIEPVSGFGKGKYKFVSPKA